MTDDENPRNNKRLRELLAGKVEAPSEFVAYHVKKACEAKAEHEALALAIAKGDQQLAALKHRALVLRAQLESHLQAIVTWDKESGGAHDSGSPAL